MIALIWIASGIGWVYYCNRKWKGTVGTVSGGLEWGFAMLLAPAAPVLLPFAILIEVVDG